MLAVEVVVLVVKSGKEGPRGKVKGRCALRLAVKMSMGTVGTATANAGSSWLLHEWSLWKIEEDLCEKWEREKGMGGFREEIMGVRT